MPWGQVRALRTLFPLTAFKNARNPKFVQNLSQRLFLGVPNQGDFFIWKNVSNFENGNFRKTSDNFFLLIVVPLTGTPKTIAGTNFGQIWGFGRF